MLQPTHKVDPLTGAETVRPEITWTYDELNRRANRLAHYLLAKGVGVDSLVGICMGRTPETVATMWAVLKAGGGFLPLPPDLPEDRRRYILADGKPRLILTQQAYLEDLIDLEAQVAVVDDDDLFADYPDTNPKAAVNPNGAAYVIYTSGSTGKPKGTILEAHSLVNLCLWYNRYFEIEPGRQVLQAFSIAFDASVKNMLSAHIAGGATVLMPDGPYDAFLVQRIIEEQQVHVMNCVPTMIYPVVELARENGYKALRSVRYLAVGGESLETAKLNHWLAGADCTLVNIYGPTEATDTTLAHKTSREEVSGVATPPIGVPVDNVKTYIVDPELGLLPPGVSGELMIAGAGLARGYLRRPALTAERFIPNPFAGPGEAGSRLYRSGDLARYGQDINKGSVFFLGRIDKQLKIRGFRVEPS